MAAFGYFDAFSENIAQAANNLSSATLKIFLTNHAPVTATDAVYADMNGNEIAGGGTTGYATGGVTVTVSAHAQAGGVFKLVGSVPSPTWTAGADTMGPFQYAILYDSSSATKSLIGYWDYGSPVTLQNGDQFTITLDGTNGILQLAHA